MSNVVLVLLIVLATVLMMVAGFMDMFSYERVVLYVSKTHLFHDGLFVLGIAILYYMYAKYNLKK